MGFDAIVVPGARVYDDGRLSPAFERRLRRAATRWSEGAAATVLISGNGPGPGTEAETGARFLAELGLPAEVVIVETRAANTRENARFAAELVSGRVLVITCDFHARRCRWIFAEHFEEAVVEGVSGTQWLRPRLREAVSIAKFLLTRQG